MGKKKKKKKLLNSVALNEIFKILCPMHILRLLWNTHLKKWIMNLFSWKHSAIDLIKHISNNNKFKWIMVSMALSCQNLANNIYKMLGFILLENHHVFKEKYNGDIEYSWELW